MSDSVFIEQAALEAAATPVLEGDPRAGQLLAEARRYIYHWPADFSGFGCELIYREGSEQFEGRLQVGGSRKIAIDLPALADTRWLRFQIEELIAHREAPSVSKMASATGCSWGDWDQVYGRRIDFLGDKMASFYRIKDKKLSQIGRSYKSQDFVINIDRHHVIGEQFVACFYTAYYWSKDKEKLLKVETYLDDYEEVGGFYLPRRRLVTEAVDGHLRTRTITFDKLRLN